MIVRRSPHLTLGILCVLLGAGLPLLMVGLALAFGDMRMSAPESVYEYVAESGKLSAEHLKVVSAGVVFAHGKHWGSSGRELFQILTPIVLLILGIVHLRAARRHQSWAEPSL